MTDDYIYLFNSNLAIDVNVQDQQWTPHLAEIQLMMQKIIEHTLSVAKYAGSNMMLELSVVLGNSEMIQDLNHRFLGKNKPTNVLSFPAGGIITAQDEPFMLGDIVFDYFTIAQEATNQSKSFLDHFYHLLIHGTLHLIGYDHVIEAEAQEMEQLEVKILENFSIQSPY